MNTQRAQGRLHTCVIRTVTWDHVLTKATLGSVLCCHHLKILNTFQQGAPNLHSVPDPECDYGRVRTTCFSGCTHTRTHHTRVTCTLAQHVYHTHHTYHTHHAHCHTHHTHSHTLYTLILSHHIRHSRIHTHTLTHHTHTPHILSQTTYTHTYSHTHTTHTVTHTHTPTTPHTFTHYIH